MPSANMCTQRGLIGIAVNEAHCISHRQVAWNRVNWKSDYDEWSGLLFEKSNCEIATSVNVKLAGWRHWTALTANEFRRLFRREGPWERAEKRLGVQATTRCPSGFGLPRSVWNIYYMAGGTFSKIARFYWLLCGLESCYLGPLQRSVQKLMNKQLQKCKQANALPRKKDWTRTKSKNNKTNTNYKSDELAERKWIVWKNRKPCKCFSYQNLTVSRTYNNNTLAKLPVAFTKSCQWYPGSQRFSKRRATKNDKWRERK